MKENLHSKQNQENERQNEIKYAKTLKEVLRNERAKERLSKSIISKGDLKINLNDLSLIFNELKIAGKCFTEKVFNLQKLLGFAPYNSNESCDGIYGKRTNKRTLEYIRNNHPALYGRLKVLAAKKTNIINNTEEQDYDKKRKERIKKGDEIVNEYDEGPIIERRILNPYMPGKYITIFVPSEIPPGAHVNMIAYFHGHGNPRAKANALKNDSWNRKHSLMGLRKMAKENKKYTALVVFEGEGEWSKWPDMCSKEKFDDLMKICKESIGISKNSADYTLMGHSHAFVFMQNLLKQMPQNYFKGGVTVLDSIYGTKKGDNWKKWCTILAQHNKTKFYFLSSKMYQSDNDPLANSKRIQDWLKKNPSGRSPEDTSFNTTWLHHSYLKAPGIRDSMKYFLGIG